MSALLMASDDRKIFRPYAVPHTAESLRALAAQVRDHAVKIEKAAELLGNSGPSLVVKLNHLKTVETGLAAIRSVVREVETKVDTRKFVKLTDERPPDKPLKNDAETKQKIRENYRNRRKDS